MANPTSTVIQTTTRTGGGLFSKLLRIKWAYVFVIIIFIQAISVGIHNGGGIVDILSALGERFFNMVHNLGETSQYVVDNQGQFSGIFDFLKVIWDLFSNAWLIYLWIKLFSWLWGRYNDSQKLFSYFLGILTFLVIDIFYLFGMYFAGAEFVSAYSFKDFILSPFRSFKLFFDAVVLIFSSLSFHGISSPASNESLNICTDLSGCVV